MTELSSKLLGIITSPTERTFWPALLVALLMVALWAPGGMRTAWLHRSALCDYQLVIVKTLAGASFVIPWATWTLALTAAGVRLLDRMLGVGSIPQVAPWQVTALYTVILFVAWDASRYALHRLVHEVPLLWRFHQVHHSAEVLTPFTLFRTHPVESLLMTARSALVTALVSAIFVHIFRQHVSEWQLLGVNGLGIIFNIAGGNLRHSHAWLSYGRFWERLFLSPAQHQIHHARDAGLQLRNYGGWLSIWDAWFGTLTLATTPPKAFGVETKDRNHDPYSWVSCVLGPVASLFRPRYLVLAAALLAAPAHAGEPDATLDTVSILGEPQDAERATGSAHTIPKEELAQKGNQDVHRVLATVPGVYVRGEDGFGLRPNIGIRGVSSDRSAKVVLMEDGVLIAPAPYSAPAAYYFPLLDRIAKVEAFKGPAAIRFGPHTIGGAINFQSRPLRATPFGLAQVGVGLDRFLRSYVRGGGGGSSWAAAIDGAHLQTDGFKELDGGGDTGFSKSEVVARGRWHTNTSGEVYQQWDARLGLSHEDSRETYLGLSDADFAATPYRRYAASRLDRMKALRTEARAAYFLSMGEGGDDFDLLATLYRHDLARTWNKLNAFAAGPPLHDIVTMPSGQSGVLAAILRGDEDSLDGSHELLIGPNQREFVSQGIDLVSHLRGTWFGYEQELELGARLHYDQVERTHSEAPYAMQSGELVRAGEDHVTADNKASTTALALRAAHQLTWDKLLVAPGARLEFMQLRSDDRIHAKTTNRFEPVGLLGLGLFYEVGEHAGVLAGVHQGFSPVTPGQDRTIAPERSINYEAGLRLGSQTHRAELVGFFSDYRHIAGECTLAAGCREALLNTQFNGGAASVLGLELLTSLEASLGPAVLTTRVVYTLTRGWFRDAFVADHPLYGTVHPGDELPYVPMHQGALDTSLRWGPWALSATVQVVSQMRDHAGQGPAPEIAVVPAHALLDAAAHYRLFDNTRLSLTINNLLNSTHMESRRPFGIRPGRPFFAALSAEVTLGDPS